MQRRWLDTPAAAAAPFSVPQHDASTAPGPRRAVHTAAPIEQAIFCRIGCNAVQLPCGMHQARTLSMQAAVLAAACSLLARHTAQLAMAAGRQGPTIGAQAAAAHPLSPSLIRGVEVQHCGGVQRHSMVQHKGPHVQTRRLKDQEHEARATKLELCPRRGPAI